MSRTALSRSIGSPIRAGFATRSGCGAPLSAPSAIRRRHCDAPPAPEARFYAENGAGLAPRRLASVGGGHYGPALPDIPAGAAAPPSAKVPVMAKIKVTNPVVELDGDEM